MPAVLGAWTLQSLDSAYQGRIHDGAFLIQASATPNSTWRSGVLASTYNSSVVPDLRVAQQASPNMSVLAGPGDFVATRAGQGPYVGYADTSTTVSIAAADPTNPRIDVVYAQILDTAVGDGSLQAIVDKVTGVPSGTPVVPAIPTNAIPLAQVAVAAGATSIVTANITDIRKSAGLVGAVRLLLPGDSLTDIGYRIGELRDNSLVVSDPNAAGIDRWDGSSWRPVSREKGRLSQGASGVLTLTTSVQDVPGSAITFVTVAPNTVVTYTAQYDWRLIVTGTGYCYGQVAVDGTTQTRAELFTAQSAETRFVGSLVDDVVIATPGTHTIKMQGHCDTSSGQATFDGASTKLFLTIANQ